MSISEQVKELRTIANNLSIGHNMSISLAIKRFRQAADTIETLSAHLQSVNMERIADSEAVKLIETMAEELSNCYGHTTELTDRAYEYINRPAEDCGVWIDGKKVIEQIENEIDGVIVKDTYSKGKNAGLRKAKIFIEEQMSHNP